MPEVRLTLDPSGALQGLQAYRGGSARTRRETDLLARSFNSAQQAMSALRQVGGGPQAGASQAAAAQVQATERVIAARQREQQLEKQLAADRDRAARDQSRLDAQALRQREAANRALLTARSTLGGAERATAGLARFQGQLNQAMKAGIIDQAEYNRLLALGRTNFNLANTNARDLRLNIAGLNSNFGQLSRSLSVLTFGPLSGVGSRLLTVQAAAQAGGASLAGLAIGVGGLAAGLVGLLALVRSTVRELDELGKTADTVGVSIEGLQRLEFTGTLAGVQNVTGALESYSRRIGEAAGGTGEAQQALEALNLHLRDLEGLTIEEQLGAIADRFKEIDDPTQRAAIAADLFSRANLRMVNVLALGSEGIREYGDEAERLGLVLSADVVRRAEELGDRMEIAGKAARVAGQQIAIELFPVVEDMAFAFLNAARGVSVFVSQVLNIPSKLRLAQELEAIRGQIEEIESGGQKGILTRLLGDGTALTNLQLREIELDVRLRIQQATAQDDLEAIREEIQRTIGFLELREGVGVDFTISQLKNALDELDRRRDVLAALGFARAFRGLREGAEGAAGATAQATDRSAEFIRNLEDQIRVARLSTREREIETAVMQLGTEATVEQIRHVRELAGVKFDEADARRAVAEAANAEQRARDRAAQESARELQRQLDENQRQANALVENFRENIQRGIGDTLTDAFRQGELSAEAFGNVTRDVIARIAAEWVALALFDPKKAVLQLQGAVNSSIGAARTIGGFLAFQSGGQTPSAGEAFPAILHPNEAVIPLTNQARVPLAVRGGRIVVPLPGSNRHVEIAAPSFQTGFAGQVDLSGLIGPSGFGPIGGGGPGAGATVPNVAGGLGALGAVSGIASVAQFAVALTQFIQALRTETRTRTHFNLSNIGGGIVEGGIDVRGAPRARSARDALKAVQGSIGGGRALTGGGVGSAVPAADAAAFLDLEEGFRNIAGTTGLEFGAFQHGGVVHRPTLGLLGEGGGSEAVVPLSSGSIPVQVRGPAPSPAPVIQAPVPAPILQTVSINVFTPDADSFRKSQGQIAATTASALQRAQSRNK